MTILALVIASGTIVALNREVAGQPVTVSLFGLILSLMFMAFQAPDVALSEIAVGAVGLPLMILLAIAKLRREEQTIQRERNREQVAKEHE
ncbi:MAG: Na(+)/H(+) antiporter subunit B [Candidatus Acidiferrales bacterium]